LLLAKFQDEVGNQSATSAEV